MGNDMTHHGARRRSCRANSVGQIAVDMLQSARGVPDAGILYDSQWMGAKHDHTQ